MAKKELGSTHAAHETRHLPFHMAKLRAGEMSQEEIKETIQEITEERDQLAEKYGMCCAHLNINGEIKCDVPQFTTVEAKNIQYIQDLEIDDFFFVKQLETHYEYGTKAPENRHLHVGIMLLQACIFELNYALGELKAYQK